MRRYRSSWKEMERGVRAAFGLAEERTQARSRLFLRNLLLFLLLFLLLVVLLVGGRRGRGRCGGHRDGGLEGLVDVHAFERRGQGLHAGVVDLHPSSREDLLQGLLIDRLAGRVQDQRPIHIFHRSSPPYTFNHPNSAPRPAAASSSEASFFSSFFSSGFLSFAPESGAAEDVSLPLR